MSIDLDSLPPEERLRKLKELKEKQEKEIAVAQQAIHDAEEELTERQKWKDKIPIPEVEGDATHLSEEGKELLKAHRGVEDKKLEEEEVVANQEKSLEETLQEEQVQQEFQQAAAQQAQYGSQLHQQPIQNLYHEIVGLNQRAEEKGYISREESDRIVYLTSAVERKLEDAREGRYSMTEELERIAGETQNLGASLQNMYKGSAFAKQEMYKVR